MKLTLQYIKGTTTLRFKYQHQANGDIPCDFSYEIWAHGQDTRESTSKYYISKQVHIDIHFT
jgi:hypothetical protein